METLTAEIIPLADACKFLEGNARRVLRTRRLGARGRPAFLMGVRAEVRRVPWGTVLVIGPGNYPLMLPGIQIVQALVAGNRVVFKPAPGTAQVAAVLVESLREAGLPKGLLTILDESPDALEPWWSRVDKVVLTGSETTGRAVMKKCAEHLLPSTMELSGCDAAIVLAGADLRRVVTCLHFGLSLNGGHSCIAPRRLIVDESMAKQLVDALATAGLQLSNADPMERPIEGESTPSPGTPGEGGGEGDFELRKLFDVRDHPHPNPLPEYRERGPEPRSAEQSCSKPFPTTPLQIIRTPNVSAMIDAVNHHPLRLGVSIFGPVGDANQIARQLSVGSIVINDLIVPTADPRLPFGGAGMSGFGVTRGAEGLLEMTRPQVISVRRGRLLLHLRPVRPQDEPLLRGQFSMSHGRRWRERGGGLLRMLKAMKS